MSLQNLNISHNITCTLGVEELTLTAFTGGEVEMG